MIAPYDKKRADKICNICYDLTKKLEIVYREAESALGTQKQAYLDCCDHEFNEYVSEEYWVKCLNSLKKEVKNTLAGLKNVEIEFNELYNKYLKEALNDTNRFPRIDEQLYDFRKNLRKHIEEVEEQKKFLEPLTKIYQIFDGEKHMEKLDECLEKSLFEIKDILNVINKHSVLLGNIDVNQQQQDKNELDSMIHLYVLTYYDHYIEKGLFERIGNKERLEIMKRRVKEVIEKNLSTKSPANQGIIESAIKEPSEQYIRYFTKDLKAFMEMLLCSAKDEYLKGSKIVPIRRRDARNIAQMINAIEKERHLYNSDEYSRIRVKLFTEPEEQGLNL